MMTTAKESILKMITGSQSMIYLMEGHKFPTHQFHNFREKPAFIGDFLYTEAGSIDIPWDYSQEKVILRLCPEQISFSILMFSF